MRDRRRWLGGPLGRELPGPAVGAGAQGVVIQEGLHSHSTGSGSGWVRRATCTRVVTYSYQEEWLSQVIENSEFGEVIQGWQPASCEKSSGGSRDRAEKEKKPRLSKGKHQGRSTSGRL